MPRTNPVLTEILKRLRSERQNSNLSQATIEERMILGPGWIERFESGNSLPTLDMILAIISEIGGTPDKIFSGLVENGSPCEIERFVYAVPDNSDLEIYFRYANFNATYRLRNATIDQFELVLKTLRDILATLAVRPANEEAIKTQAVTRSFLKAIKFWPHANPSDIWWFIIYRAYCDPFNHPASYARLDLSQSWKRTGGWALEEVLVQFYAPFLANHGIKLFIPRSSEKNRLLKQLQVKDRLEADKVDVLLTGTRKGVEKCFGVVHVKASFAERRTDDVPMSKSLVDAGYISPLWTMDCKSMPSKTPTNKGELGDIKTAQNDLRSAKRKDIEDDGYFSACFSYNHNTKPTPNKQPAKAKIIRCSLSTPNDKFSRFIIQSWKNHP